MYTDQIEQLKSTHEKQTEKLLKSLHETEEDYGNSIYITSSLQLI